MNEYITNETNKNLIYFLTDAHRIIIDKIYDDKDATNFTIFHTTHLVPITKEIFESFGFKVELRYVDGSIVGSEALKNPKYYPWLPYKIDYPDGSFTWMKGEPVISDDDKLNLIPHNLFTFKLSI